MRIASLASLAIAIAAACGGDERDERAVDHRTPDERLPGREAALAECVAASTGGLADAGFPKAQFADLIDARRKVIQRLCTEERWSAASARCLAAADGLMEIGHCMNDLPRQSRISEELRSLNRIYLHTP